MTVRVRLPSGVVAETVTVAMRDVGEVTWVEVTVTPAPNETVVLPATNCVLDVPFTRTGTFVAPRVAERTSGNESAMICKLTPEADSPVTVFTTRTAAGPTGRVVGTLRPIRRSPLV